MVDDGDRDDVANVLGVARQALEGDADAFAARVEDGPAAVARVDRGVDLDAEQLGRAVRVGQDLDARDDAARDRDGVAADRVADDGDGVLEPREAAKLERPEALPERVVVNGQQGDVALGAYGEDLGEELGVVASALDLKEVDFLLLLLEIC